MATHPVHALKAALERKRLDCINALAEASGEPSWEALTQLATVQGALRAIKEAIEEHGQKMGWGPSEALK